MMDILNIVSFIIGLVSLVLTVRYGDQARKSYHLVMTNFEQRVIEVLMNSLKAGSLRDADQVRGIVENVALEYGINPPPDEEIVRILRRIALRYQQGTLNERTKAILAHLEQIRSEIEPTGLPLASIASVNKLAALLLILGAGLLTLLFLQVSNILRAGPPWITVGCAAGELLLLLTMGTVSRRLRKMSRNGRAEA